MICGSSSSQHLTSYAGLELVRRYVRKLEIVVRLRAALAAIPSDYGSARLALLVMGLYYVPYSPTT